MKHPYILHQFIHETPGTRDFERSTSFPVKHALGIGVALSLLFHVGVYGLMLYERYFAPYQAIEVVDKETDIQWITLNDPRFKPLKNPGRGFVVPEKVLSLFEMERLRQEEEKRRAARKTVEKPEPPEGKPDGRTDGETDGKSGDGTPTEPAPPSSPPKFGVINSRPLKEIVGKIYEKYKQGELQVAENAVFKITLTFTVRKDGTLANIKIVQSSGSPEIDEAAYNIANALSESHALQPLSSLTSMSISLDNGASLSSLRIIGFASQPEDASSLAAVYNAAVAFAQFKNRDAQPDVAEMLRNMEIKADGKRLTGLISMSRSQANSLMRKGFAGKTS